MGQRKSPVEREASNRLLRVALASMPYGFAVWDEELRLVLWNKRMLEMYGFPEERVAAGMSVRDVCQLSIEIGNRPPETLDATVAFYTEMARTAPAGGTSSKHQFPLGDRVYATSYARLPGLGIIVVHQDATEEVLRAQKDQQQKEALERQNQWFDIAINNMSDGLSVFDKDQRLVVCNANYVTMFNLPAELSRPGAAHADIMAFRVANGMKIVGRDEHYLEWHQVFLDDPQAGTVRVEMADGRVIDMRHRPMPDGGWVSTQADVTAELHRVAALEQRERDLALQNHRFEAAIGNMAEGLCMFDGDERLIVCNPQYAALYALPPELTRPGTMLEDILGYRFSHGSVPEEGPEHFVATGRQLIAQRGSNKSVSKLRDGRAISIQHQPIGDGGWVATHQDISEDLRRVDALEARERDLAVQNLRLDAAVNNISQGLCMFDGAQRLVICNERYASMYALPPSLMQPGTTLTEILIYRLDHGIEPLMGREAYLRSRLTLVEAGLSAKDVTELADGRTISVQHHPIPDGGWVSTHEDITEQRQTEARIRHLARHDPLTDLPNRLAFREEMEFIEVRIARDANVAVLCVDLDHFKAINDTLGHACGDAVLIEVAKRLGAAMRPTDFVARLGGDEFALLVSPVGGPNDAAAVAEAIVRSIALPMYIDERQIDIGASVGIAMAPGDGDSAEILLKNADLALYRAKTIGRGGYHFFEKSMDAAMQQRRSLEQGLKGALARDEFRLSFQPLLKLSTNRISCLEALLRWHHPERGLISPADFIPVAEETGAIVAIGEWVLRQACIIAARWPADVRVAVNLSPAQFRNRHLVGQVRDALAVARLDPSRLELEITESLLLDDTDSNVGTLHELRALGVRIAMDDFGTGYSSLSYLRSFPFDKIKIDRSFMTSISSHGESNAIVKAVIGLAHSLGMETTAEGIETEAQLEAVRAQGCDEVQGFLFSPPMPASQVDALLAALSAEGGAPLRAVKAS